MATVRAWLSDAEPERIAPLRREAVAFASQHGMADAQLPDLAIALSEVLANMVAHSRGNGGAGAVAMTVDVGDADVLVRVRGSGLAAPRIDNPEVRIGMEVVAALARSLSVESHDGGTAVSMVFNRRAT